MIGLKLSFQKSVFAFLFFFFSCSVFFSENVYKIKETELNRILEQTKILEETVKKQSTQLQQYQILSSELKKDAENQKKKAEIYRDVAVGACVTSCVLGGILYLTNR